MSDKKTIQFADSFLTLNKTRKSGGKKEKKEKPIAVIKPTTLRKTLLEKIKRHQQDEKMKKNDIISSTETASKDKLFKDDFLNSMEYLEKISEQKKQHNTNKSRKNKTLKNTPNPHDNKNGGNYRNTTYPDLSLISIDLPPNFDNDNSTNNMTNNPMLHGGINLHAVSSTPTAYMPITAFTPTSAPMPVAPIPTAPMPPVYHTPPIQQYNTEPYNNSGITIYDPPSGCLKGGSKPTYREFHNKTLKKSAIRYNMSRNTHHSIHSGHPNNKKNDVIHIQNKKNRSRHNKIKQKTRHTKKTTFKLGKYGGNVSVLIKNNATRRKIKREHGILKQKPIVEIKKYLYDKNLLRLGSTAPNDVLRTLYEESVLAGDITNINNDVTLHNFLERGVV